MNVVRAISENKHTKRRFITRVDGGKEITEAAGHKSMIGRCEAIVEIDGQLVTRHLIKVEARKEAL